MTVDRAEVILLLLTTALWLGMRLRRKVGARARTPEEWQGRVPRGSPISIAEVELRPDGALHVRPDIPAPQCYEFIWRAAMGVRWSDQSRALIPYEVREQSPAWWFFQITGAVRSEYGQVLELTGRTKWTNVPPSIRGDIERGLIPDAD